LAANCIDPATGHPFKVFGFPEGSPMGLRVVSVKLDEAVLEEVEAIAREEGVSRSEVIRRAVSKYLREKGHRLQASLSRARGREHHTRS